jgi:hypothetical protein
MNKLQKGKYILFFIVDILTNHSELENSLGHMTVLNADSDNKKKYIFAFLKFIHNEKENLINLNDIHS